MKDVAFHFTPVELERRRARGWTADRQHRFIEALARTGHVGAAAASVGLSARSAYRLRDRPDAGSFDTAWQIAIDYAMARALRPALAAALGGEYVPVISKGRVIGRRRQLDLARQLRVFTALGQGAKGEKAREQARHDRDMRRAVLANRQRLDAEDAAQAREKAKFEAECKRQLAEAQAASRSRAAPRVRIL